MYTYCLVRRICKLKSNWYLGHNWHTRTFLESRPVDILWQTCTRQILFLCSGDESASFSARMSAVRGLFLELLLLAWTTTLSIPLTKQCLLFELYLSGHWRWHEGFRPEGSSFQSGLHWRINQSFCFLFSTIPVDKLLSESSKGSSLPIAYQRKEMWEQYILKTYDTCLPGDYTSFADGTCYLDFSAFADISPKYCFIIKKDFHLSLKIISWLNDNWYNDSQAQRSFSRRLLGLIRQ